MSARIHNFQNCGCLSTYTNKGSEVDLLSQKLFSEETIFQNLSLHTHLGQYFEKYLFLDEIVEEESEASAAAGEYIKEIAESAVEQEILENDTDDKEKEAKIEVTEEAIESYNKEENSDEEETTINGLQKEAIESYNKVEISDENETTINGIQGDMDEENSTVSFCQFFKF